MAALLDEYLEPGFYDRQTFVDDARTAYMRLGNARMIVWLNEAAGEDPRLIHAAIVAAQERVNTYAEARYARNRPYCANVTNRSQPIVIVPAASERK